MTTLDTRYSFTAQFLRGATIFANRAREIESGAGTSANEDTVSEHRAFVVAAIMQSTAGLEAEISEVATYGPGHHLGSNGVDSSARDFLLPIAEIIDEQQTLERYQIVLHLLRKQRFDPGQHLFQSAALLIRLRNELVHYKSRWGREMDSKKLFTSLKALKHGKPPFVPSNTNFFPHQCLSADCAAWSVRTASTFINAFYGELGIRSPLDNYQTKILGGSK